MFDSNSIQPQVETMLNCGHWSYDLTTGKVWWSDQVYRIYGYEPGHVEPSYDMAVRAFVDGDREAFEADMARAIEDGTPYKFVRKIKRLDGQVRYIRAYGKPVSNEVGTIVGVVGAIQDVTQEQQRLRKYTEYEQIISDVGEAGNIGYWTLDFVSEQLEWSDQVYRIHGYEPGEVTLTLEKAIEFYHPADQERVAKLVQKSRATGEPFEFHAKIIQKSGLVVEVHSKGHPVGEGTETVGLFGIIQDITEQIGLANQLSMSSYLVENTPEGVVVTNKDGLALWVNKSFQTLTGYGLDDVIGKKPGSLLQGPDTDPDTVKRLGAAIAAGEPVTEEILNYNRFGEPYWIRMSIFPQRDEAGEIIHFMAIEVDITEQVNARLEVSRSNKKLERLNFQLNRQKDAAETFAEGLEETKAALEKQLKRSLELQEQLRQLAHFDELTEIANRRSFLDKAQAERNRAARYGIPLTIALLDIDHFKKVNDTYGHDVGDMVLRQFARRVENQLRVDCDLMGRLGGEEFAVLLPETNLSQAQAVMERVRKAVGDTPLTDKITVTCSIGIAELTDEATIDEVIKNADLSLYEAKRSGRNRVLVQAR